MKPEWSAGSYRELGSVQQYIALDNNDKVAWNVVMKILETVDLLESHPYTGRPSEWRDRRELVIAPYIIVYSVHRSGVRVHSLTHGTQRK